MLTRMLAGALLLALQPTPPADPRAVVGHALAAVEGDSVAAVRARWAARTPAGGTDRAAHLGLATLARLTYAPESAARAYRALDRARPDGVAAYARLGLAEQLYMQGRNGEAEVEFERARDAARESRLGAVEATALGFLGMLRANTTGLDAGLAALDSADRVVPPAAAESRADLLRFRAVMQAVTGDAESASRTAARCVAEARRAAIVRAEAQCLRAEALNRKLQAEDDSALRVLDAVVRLQRRARDRAALAETLVRQADALRTVARYGEARAALREARAEAIASRNDLALGSVHTGLGSLALRLRDHGAAAGHLRDARALYARTGDSLSLLNVTAYQSILDAAVGDLASARRNAASAAAAYARVDDPSEELATLRQLASVEMRGGDHDAAARALDAAAAAARRLGDGPLVEQLAYDRGRLALRRGDLASAERHMLRYLAHVDTADHLTLHATRTYVAEVRARRGDLDGAARELHRAGDALDAWRASLSDDSLRLHAFQATSHDLAAHDPTVARVLGALAAGGRVADAFALAERSRARSLADRMAQASALRASGDAGAAGAPAGAAAGTSRTTFGVAAAHDRTIGTLAATLPAGTALVEYVAGRDGVPTTAIVVTRGGLRAYPLAPADSLHRTIERLAALLAAGEDAAAPARALGAALLDGVVADLPSDVTRLVVVPDGPLHRVPFDALRLADGRHVVERFGVSLAPSAGVAAALWQRPRTTRGPTRLLALGDPAFATTPQPATNGADDGGEPLPRLAGSGAEARAVARFARHADVRLRERASAAWLRTAPLEEYDVIHLATHAIVDDRAIGRSSIALAPDGATNGLLGPGDLAALRLRADLVVLSACRTAGGVVLDGEGVQGLTAPLLRAGARAVVATAWRIDDARTVALVTDFYRSLADGRPAGDALRSAKLRAIARGAPPSEWAAFTLVGDPLVTLDLAQPRATPAWPWLAAVVAAAVGVLAAGVTLVRRRHAR